MVDHQIQHFSDYQKRCLFFVPIYLFIYMAFSRWDERSEGDMQQRATLMAEATKLKSIKKI